MFIPNCWSLCWCLGKNSSFLRVVRCRSLAEEYSVDSVNKDEISKLETNFLSDSTVRFHSFSILVFELTLVLCSLVVSVKHIHLLTMAVCPQPHAWTIQIARWSSTSCFVLLIASTSNTPATQVCLYRSFFKEFTKSVICVFGKLKIFLQAGAVWLLSDYQLVPSIGKESNNLLYAC